MIGWVLLVTKEERLPKYMKKRLSQGATKDKRTYKFKISSAAGCASSSVTSTFRPHSISHAIPSGTKPVASTCRGRVGETEGER